MVHDPHAWNAYPASALSVATTPPGPRFEDLQKQGRSYSYFPPCPELFWESAFIQINWFKFLFSGNLSNSTFFRQSMLQGHSRLRSLGSPGETNGLPSQMVITVVPAAAFV